VVCDDELSPPPNATLKNAWSYTSPPHISSDIMLLPLTFDLSVYRVFAINFHTAFRSFTNPNPTYSQHWEELRLRVFENRMLRGIFGPKRDEVTGEWRKLHNEELHDLYSSPTLVRVMISMRWAGYVERYGGGGGVYTVLVGKPG
jgi:hypothetical protein